MLPRPLYLVLLASLILTSCQASVLGPDSKPDLPVPSWAEDAKLMQLEDGRWQLSFVSAEAFPSARTRNFYAQWAQENGWEKVPVEVESWSVDGWISFIGMDGTKVDQWTVHWKGENETQSLRLIARHWGDRSEQEVYLVVSPFDLFGPDEGE